METKDRLTNYYEAYDEEGRLISKHGMVEYITTMKYIEKYLKPICESWRLVQEQVDIAMLWHKKAIEWMPSN